MSSTKTPSKLSAVVISDIHLGHPRTTTAEIIYGLNKAFTKRLLEFVDFVFIAGDLFDRDLAVPQTEVELIFDWWASFLRLCKSCNVKVRVLEGTPSHDYRQFRVFGRINHESHIGADCVYHDDLAVERDQSGITILYLPDEYSDTCAETEVKIRELLDRESLEQVDLVIMHGQFKHQFPEKISAKLDCHDADFFLSIARHFVFVGHVHEYSQYKRIVAQGSFDRLCHGSENPKGMILTMLDLPNPAKSSCTFLENLNAKEFLTVKISERESLEDAGDRLHDVATMLRSDAYLRVQAHEDHPIFGALSDFKKLYPSINWSVKRESQAKDKPEPDNIPSLAEIRSRVSINPNNLRQLILKRLTDADDVTHIMEVLSHVGVA